MKQKKSQSEVRLDKVQIQIGKTAEEGEGGRGSKNRRPIRKRNGWGELDPRQEYIAE